MADKKSTAKQQSKAGARKLKSPKYSSFRLQKRIKRPGQVPGAPRLLAGAVKVLGSNWKVFAGIIGVYALLNILFAQGLAALQNLDSAKTSLDQAESSSGALVTGLALFVSLAGFANTDPAAAVYQFVLALIASLAVVWALRQVYAQNMVRVRDAFYKGMFPLVPFVLVLLVIGVQLIPFLIGAFVYSIVSATGVAASAAELVLWGTMFFLLALASLYMVASSIFALYIVCLPDMTPIQALRSARKLVLGRRWMVLRKVVFLPIAIVLLALVLLMPLLVYATAIAGWVYFLYSMAGLAIVHSYMYRLYRSLL